VEFIPKGPMDAGRFYEEFKKLAGEKRGLYIYWSKSNYKVLYIGISTNIEGRIYQHIGPNYVWRKSGSTASFPKCRLVWDKFSEEVKDTLHNNNFNITAYILRPSEISSLLESFLIFYGHKHNWQPDCNIGF
jgi:predicted GIY-YIG superfamily endonuclease